MERLERTPIRSALLREHFLADYLDELKPEIVINNFNSTEKILTYPEDYPNANFEWVDVLNNELFLLIEMNRDYFYGHKY